MNKSRILIYLAFVGLLIGCNASDQSGLMTDYSRLKQSQVTDAPLKLTNQAELEHYLKNGIRLRLNGSGFGIGGVAAMAAEDSASTSGSSEAGGTGLGGNFSSTNLHENGVDEADRLKYDGEYLYVVSRPEYSNHPQPLTSDPDTNGEQSNLIRILRTESQTGLVEPVSQIDLASDQVQLTDIFLMSDPDYLISIASSGDGYWHNWLVEDALADDEFQWQSGKIELQAFDVSDPLSPLNQWKLEIEGNLEGARRVGQILYVVSRFMPDVAELNYAAANDTQKLVNEQIIQATPLSELLPHYQLNDGEIRPLVTADDCYLSESIESDEGYADLVTLSAINLLTHEIESAVCINTNIQGIYSSTSGFYLGASSNDPWMGFSNLTAVHKFALDGGLVEYRASGSVPGYLGWQDPSFRMSEYNQDLRIVTTDFAGQDSWSDPEHRLTILRDDGSAQLKAIASLPNVNQPEPIGKPGEAIYAVRFSGTRAYVITFEQVDPLYVIDLSQPTTPSIVGALEIPGFSRYLHPLSNNWLLGIGNEVTDGLTQGLKVELYDLRDVTEPKVQNKIVLGDRNSWSEAQFDLRSFSFLNIDENHSRFSIPASLYQVVEDNDYAQWQESGLYAFELNQQNDDDWQLAFAGKILTEQASAELNYPQMAGAGRSALHDEALFYLHGNQIWSSLWGQWSEIIGPF